MEVQGKLLVVKDAQTFGKEKTFTKRECVIETQEQYPQPLMIEFVQDKCSLLDKFSIGDSVKISINLRGRKWESPDKGDVYFNSIQGWRIERADEIEVPKVEEKIGLDLDSDDGLPFNGEL